MERREILEQTREYVRNTLAGEGTGHDWYHVDRVCRLARRLAEEEKGTDLYIVELAALLHDIADWKFHDGDESVGPDRAVEWLSGLDVESDIIDRVVQIIREVSFKGAGVDHRPSTPEGRVVQDADRLDALGAIGIARAFAYGGYRSNPIHDPLQQPRMHETFEEYKRSDGTSINHFYEKLLLLTDRMNTEAAKRFAVERHRYMCDFLERFLEEWDAER
ncbi:MAG: HD domain-containing protein [Acidobacteriota bacterium]|nr:MAG: HD domain-containing protein [Acidobacteriota bacterium]